MRDYVLFVGIVVRFRAWFLVRGNEGLLDQIEAGFVRYFITIYIAIGFCCWFGRWLRKKFVLVVEEIQTELFIIDDGWYLMEFQCVYFHFGRIYNKCEICDRIHKLDTNKLKHANQ